MNKVTYSQTCSITSQCIDKLNGTTLVCTMGTCACTANNYWNNNICTPIIGYNGGSCNGNQQCDATKNLTCISSTCTCASGLYWDGIVCTIQKLPTLNCSSSYECINNTICAYANNSASTTTCICYNSYFFNQTSNTCGKSKPSKPFLIFFFLNLFLLKDSKLGYNSICKQQIECNDLLGLQCTSNICGCPSKYFLWKSLRIILFSFYFYFKVIIGAERDAALY